MGRRTFSVAAYNAASDESLREIRAGRAATARAEQIAHSTGKLNPLVDPAEFGVIRRSLVRFEERPDGLFELTIGCSMPIETRLDTTGSMGGNVDIAMQVLPQTYGLCSSVLPGYDLHMALGIFGDVADSFPLCRPQFEMEAEKLVDQLSRMVPERAGADTEEDPHYGLFAGAYLTRAYANQIGLKGYDFTTSDAPAHDRLSEKQLKRIFGAEVFGKAKLNGFDIDPNDLPSNKEVVGALLDRAHAFFLQVGGSAYTTSFWTKLFGTERVVALPSTELLPQVQATIVGLTEGTLTLDQVGDFLRENNVKDSDAQAITRSVSNIPIGAQAVLREGIRVPQKGDLFRAKPDVFKGTNLWPIDPSEVPDVTGPSTDTDPVADDGPTWL